MVIREKELILLLVWKQSSKLCDSASERCWSSFSYQTVFGHLACSTSQRFLIVDEGLLIWDSWFFDFDEGFLMVDLKVKKNFLKIVFLRNSSLNNLRKNLDFYKVRR